LKQCKRVRRNPGKNEIGGKTVSLYENAIKLKGFVGKDADSRAAGNGNIMATFSLATRSSYKTKQGGWISRTDWHRVVCFAALAESAKSLQKGDYVEIEGELRSSEFHREVGEGEEKALVKRRSWEIRATEIRKLVWPPQRDEIFDSVPGDQGDAR
jgi:single-strand DNA-binding protein